jgi:hypothetical protein
MTLIGCRVSMNMNGATQGAERKNDEGMVKGRESGCLQARPVHARKQNGNLFVRRRPCLYERFTHNSN